MSAVGAGHRLSALAVAAVLALVPGTGPSGPALEGVAAGGVPLVLDGWRCQDVDPAAIGLPQAIDAGERNDVPVGDLPTGDAPRESNRRPTILAHGWLGGASAWDAVTERFAGSFATPPEVYRFDYAAVNDYWAGQPEIAGCLAAYIAAVSRAWSEAGGDGRVLLVGHSMGGLAIRYASAYTVDGTETGERIAGVITVNTPHLGSAWGGPGYAEYWSTWNRARMLDMTPMPDPDSGAARCLGPRAENAQMPGQCGGIPPYLPAEVPVREIAGRVSLTRYYFPFLGGPELYTVALGGDGIVTATSQHGYVFSGPPEQTPGEDVRTVTVDCTVSNDVVLSAALAIAPEVTARFTILLGTWFNDRAVMDDIAAGTISEHWIPILPTAAAIADCGHIRILTSDAGTAAIATALADVMAATPVAPSSDDPWLLSVDGIGPYRVGTTGAELIAAGLLVDAGPNEFCGDPNTPQGRHYLTAGEYADSVGPFFSAGVVVAVGASSPLVHSPEGAYVGMYLDDLQRIYGAAGQVMTPAYEADPSAARTRAFVVEVQGGVEVFYLSSGEHSPRDQVTTYQAGDAGLLLAMFNAIDFLNVDCALA